VPGQKRTSGDVAINGVPYLVLKDKDGNFVYARKSAPKKSVTSTRKNAFTGESNLLEVRFDYKDGFGDQQADDTRDTIHFSMNLFTEREQEAVVLPALLSLVPDDDSDPVIADIQLQWSAPVFIWEQLDDVGDVETYWLADHRAFSISERTNLDISVDEDMFFESTTSPTGGATFSNVAYAAMGGGKRTTDRYIRRRDTPAGGGTWTNDDNNPLSIDEVSAAEVVRTTTPHGYLVGDVVYITASTITAFNGLWTITAVSDTTHFTIAALVSSGASVTATVNVQDSDVKAEQLCIVGDEMVRTFYDTTSGWQTSRVDIVGSNELLVANWTAGIGTLSVGDSEGIPTALIAFGDGELVGKPEGMFAYQDDRALYANEIIELESHRHPDNCRGMAEYKGWVYIPTAIGLLRWKNGILQDVTPGRGATQGFDTPIGPIAAITGDANRLYAITQPFKINQPQTAAAKTKHFAYAQGGGYITPSFSNESKVFDGDQDSHENLSSMVAADGHIYFGCSEQFHRIFMRFTQPGQTSGVTDADGFQITNGAVLTIELWCDTNGDGIGDAWVSRTIHYDGTRGWKNTDNDPTCLFQTGDVVFGPLTHPSTGEDVWKSDANLASEGNLTAAVYWARVTVSQNISGNGTTLLEEVDFGIHVNTAFEPYHTTEIANDHGGIVYVLTMTEEQGRGVVWRVLWALSVPDLARTSERVYGGTQRVGTAKIVQPGFLRSHLTGDRYLFIGLQNINYLCPLGNRPDPTNQAYLQWYPYTDEGIDGGTRPVVLQLPYTDFGLPTDLKTLKEIEFQTEGVDLSGVEVWYSKDYEAFVFVGYADDLTPNMPIILPSGTEPSGYQFSVGISYDAASERPVRLDRFGPISLRAQPRPKMADTITLTVELEPEQVLARMVTRSAAHNQYDALKDLEEGATSVEFINISGQSEFVQVLQVGQRAIFNTDNRPKLYADIVLTVTKERVEA